MNVDEFAFLQHIDRNPDDVLPRLAFADWLEEQNRFQQADLIRAAATGIPDPIAQQSFQQLVLQLIPKRAQECWKVEEVNGIPRILVISKNAGYKQLILEGNRLLNEIPSIQKLRLTAPVDTDHFNLFLKSPILSRFNELDFDGISIHAQRIDVMIDNPALEGLKTLKLTRSRFEDDGLSRLLASKQFNGIESLTMEGIHLAPLMPEEVIEAPIWQNLKTLSLINVDLLTPRGQSRLFTPVEDTPDAFESWFFRTAALSQLESLYLRGISRISPVLSRIVQSDASKTLRKLKLTNIYLLDQEYQIEQSPLSMLARAPGFSNLVELECRQINSLPRLNIENGQNFLATKRLPNLEKLTLSGIKLSQFQNLPKDTTGFPKLTKLDLNYNFLRTEGIQSLVDSAIFNGIEELNLSYNSLTTKALDALLTSSKLGQLKKLNLARNRISSISSLISTPKLPKLETLNLARNQITPKGLQIGKKAICTLKPVELNLSMNPVTDAGIGALMSWLDPTSIRSLELNDCQLTQEGLKWLCNPIIWEQLVQLGLIESVPGQLDTTILASYKGFPALRDLRLFARDPRISAVNSDRIQQRLEGLRRSPHFHPQALANAAIPRSAEEYSELD
jgi:uncharacterized protein (TIGR02996 family)